jgi:hypothetical protein
MYTSTSLLSLPHCCQLSSEIFLPQTTPKVLLLEKKFCRRRCSKYGINTLTFAIKHEKLFHNLKRTRKKHSNNIFSQQLIFCLDFSMEDADGDLHMSLFKQVPEG